MRGSISGPVLLLAWRGRGGLREWVDRYLSMIAMKPGVAPTIPTFCTRRGFVSGSSGGRFERLIPNCELRYLKGLGHVPMSDDPELLAAAIRDFAGRPAPAAASATPVG